MKVGAFVSVCRGCEGETVVESPALRVAVEHTVEENEVVPV